jgi:MOSC domain-containing protein YiiM
VELLSVNVGRPQPNPWKDTLTTGIDKQPVDGPVMVTAPGPKGAGDVGLAGDRVFDVKNHGGTDQAVYAYAREDLDTWAAVLGRPLVNGAFGENLTTVGVDVNGALVGERWRVGDALVLEVSCPRIPCSTFAGWLDRKGWVRQFTEAAIPGAFLRVVEPGAVQRGDAVQILHRPDHEVTIAVAFRAVTLEPDLLPLLLTAEGLAAESRDHAAARLGDRGARAVG